MRFEHNGVTIDLDFDHEGYPLVDIHLNGFTGEYDRPTIVVSVNDVMIHEMFGDHDFRWLNIDPSDWSIEKCMKWIDFEAGIDTNTIDDIADDDVEGWRNRVLIELENLKSDGGRL